MDKLHFVHNGFSEAWKFFKTYNPTTEEEWDDAIEVADGLRAEFSKQSTDVGDLIGAILFAIIDFKEKEWRQSNGR